MNFIFVTVLIFIILIPGFLLRLSYFSAPFSKKFTGTNLIIDLTWSILPGLLIHFIATLLVPIFTTYSIRYDYVGVLLLSITDKVLIPEIFNNIQKFLPQIIGYNLCILAFSIITGYVGKSIVRHFKLDRKWRFFRFSSRWYYVLSGECLDFRHVPDSYEDINFKLVDVLCQVGNEQVIYIGELIDWYLDDAGNLDTIHLRNPFRRKLSADDKPIAERYYRIPTRYLVIPYKNIININVRYFAIKEVKAQEQKAEKLIEQKEQGNQ